MPRDLILHAHFNIFPFVSLDAFRTKLLPKFARQFSVASEKARLQHRGLCAHITVGLRNRFFNGTRGVPHFETTVPEQIENLVHHFLQVRRNLVSLPMQQHDVNVTERVELAPAISAESNQRQRNLRPAIFASSRGSSAENVLQQNIDELSAPRANFAAAPAGLVLQTQSMLFNLEKFFVKRESLSRSSASCGRKTIFSVRQNLFEVSGHSHRQFRLRFNLKLEIQNPNPPPSPKNRIPGPDSASAFYPLKKFSISGTT